VPGNGWLPVEATPGFAIPALDLPGKTTGPVFSRTGLTGPAAVITISFVILFTVLVIGKLLKGKQRDTLPLSEHCRGTGLYGEVVSWLAGKGWAPKSYETPNEFAGRVGSAFPDIKELVKSVAAEFTSWRYGNKELDNRRQSDLKADWEVWRQKSTKR